MFAHPQPAAPLTNLLASPRHGCVPKNQSTLRLVTESPLASAFAAFSAALPRLFLSDLD